MDVTGGVKKKGDSFEGRLFIHASFFATFILRPFTQSVNVSNDFTGRYAVSSFKLTGMINKNLKLTFFVNLYGLLKIPLVLFVNPRVVLMSAQKFIIKIPLNFRTKNHLNSMYFGAMGVGAELSIAGPAVILIHESKMKIDFVFKDFQASYLKRAEGDVHFVCEDVESVSHLIEQSKTSPERFEKKIKGYAVVPGKNQTEPVMTYELTLSVRNRSYKAKA